MDTARLAIVGAGVIGKRHMAAIADTPCAELVAIVDPVPTVKSLAEASGIQWFADIEDMLAAAKPDGVIVATPTEHHLAPVLAAMDAGAHVLVEKPITPSLAQAEEIITRSATTRRHVLVGHHRRHYPVLPKARGLVQGGALGQLVAVSGQWNVKKPSSYFEPDWRKKREAGPVLTNLIHEMDSLRFICGDMASISAESRSRLAGSSSGNNSPISPSAAAPKMASVIACKSTSASLWPAMWWSWAMSIPPRRKGPPDSRRCVSCPMPMRMRLMAKG